MSRRPSRATETRAVALLRAYGEFSVEETAALLGMTVREVDELAERGTSPHHGVKPRWSRERFAREARRFFRREGRWPNSKDFRDARMRRLGLPSWDNLRKQMTGFHPREWSWSHWAQDDERRQALSNLRAEGLVLPTEDLPTNGWVVLQRWMVQNCSLTPREIIALPNALIRREGMERYGFDRMVREGHATHIATDEFGSLYEFPGEGEKLVMVKVTNKTREPDGTFAEYFLRVPPTMTVPKQAVAWTFDVTEGWEDFQMVVET